MKTFAVIIGLHLNPRVFGPEPDTEEPEAGTSNSEYRMNAANIKAEFASPSAALLAENLKREKWLRDLRKTLWGLVIITYVSLHNAFQRAECFPIIISLNSHKSQG